jgi:hypothetical protein
MIDRIWISSEVVEVAGFNLPDHEDPTEVEYIRADIHEAALATARREAKDAALEEAAALCWWGLFAPGDDRVWLDVALAQAESEPEAASPLSATGDGPEATRASTGAPSGGDGL